MPLLILLVFGLGVSLVLRGLSATAIPGREGGFPTCGSARVAQQIRDLYGRQIWLLYRLVPFDSWRAALFLDLSHARQIAATSVSRTCLGTYQTLSGTGTLKFRVTWLNARNPDDGRIAVGIVSGSPPELAERLKRALRETSAPTSHPPTAASRHHAED